MFQNFELCDKGLPVVSICCLVYNHDEYLVQALDSFLMQKTTFPIEIVIHDDASTDNSVSIIKEYALKYPKLFKPLYQRENQKSKVKSGMNPRFNFPRAKGKYIALCEGDDYWTDPYKLQKQVDLLERFPELIASHHSQLKQKDNELFEEIRFQDLKDGDVSQASDLFSFKIQPQTRTLLFRNCLVYKDLNSDFMHEAIYGDFAICFLLAQYGGFGYIKQNMAVYRIHDKGVATISMKTKEDYLITRFRLVEMWCRAYKFLDCNKKSFINGILILYSSGIQRVGRKRGFIAISKHLFKMPIDLKIMVEIYLKLIIKIIKNL